MALLADRTAGDLVGAQVEDLIHLDDLVMFHERKRMRVGGRGDRFELRLRGAQRARGLGAR